MEQSEHKSVAKLEDTVMSVGDFGHCCTDCQIYWTCETKWYRGERHEEDICCTICNYYNECQRIWKEKNKSSKKKRKQS